MSSAEIQKGGSYVTVSWAHASHCCLLQLLRAHGKRPFPVGSLQTTGMSRFQLSTRKPVAIHPSSSLAMCKPAYVIYNELVQTSKTYMRWTAMLQTLNAWWPCTCSSVVWVISTRERITERKFQVFHHQCDIVLCAVWLPFEVCCTSYRDVCVVDAEWLYETAPNFFRLRNPSKNRWHASCSWRCKFLLLSSSHGSTVPKACVVGQKV